MHIVIPECATDANPQSGTLVSQQMLGVQLVGLLTFRDSKKSYAQSQAV